MVRFSVGAPRVGIVWWVAPASVAVEAQGMSRSASAATCEASCALLFCASTTSVGTVEARRRPSAGRFATMSLEPRASPPASAARASQAGSSAAPPVSQCRKARTRCALGRANRGMACIR